MLKIAGIITGLLATMFLVFSWFAGIFDTLTLTRETAGPYYLVYREHRGPYAGMRYILNDVYRYLRGKKLDMHVQSGFGIYYDNPQEVPQDSLRSSAGVVTDSLLKVESPYKSGIYEKTDAVVGRFPIRSFFSYTTGAGKFYDVLQSYLDEHDLGLSGPVLEMYNSSERLLIYVAPIGGTDSPAPRFGTTENDAS